MLACILLLVTSCKKDEPTPEKPLYTVEFDVAFQDPNQTSIYSVVIFTNRSTGADHYNWDFGDGSSSTSENPQHSYTTAGTKQIKLTAYFPDGNSLSKTKSITIDPAPAISANFSASTNICNVQETISFTNLSQGAINYQWNFGDGQSSIAANPTHAYSSIGTYTVTLTAYGPLGQVDLKTSSILVSNTPFASLSEITIGQLISQFSGTTIQLGHGNKISGTVISDYYNSNMASSKNMVVWNGTEGILARCQSPHSFALGSKVVINLSTAFLKNYFSTLELDSVPLSNIVQDGTGVNFPPRTTTVSQVTQNLTAWTSTLIKINNVTISGAASTYGGSLTISDATGSMILFTRSWASFAGASYPTTSVSITGILNNYNGIAELFLRNTTDVQ
ncbi:MAG TPA: DUF5689 domain-containing protein [Bacteroidia bacterium]|nr:DUF5689 domain-containing protein [Bacteroidia bacterium]